MSYTSLGAWRRAEPQQAAALGLEEHVLCVKRIQWSCLCISVCVSTRCYLCGYIRASGTICSFRLQEAGIGHAYLLCPG